MNKQLTAARERGKVGSRRAGDRADRASEGWTERAAVIIRQFAKYEKGAFTIEKVRFGMWMYAGQPPDNRAWGQATRLAERNGWIKRVGYARAVSSHYSPKCLWAKT